MPTLSPSLVTPCRTLVEKYSQPGPRYTSYPTVPFWSKKYGSADYAQALAHLVSTSAGISLYVHVPFCERRCTFCACNVIISREHAQGTAYVDSIIQEMDLVLAATGGKRPTVTQLHWGGGTPTWLPAEQLALLFDRIQERFVLLPDREQSVEVHPVVTTAEQLDVMRSRGLNRLSMGVQDFNPVVQKVIHRDQTYEQTARLIAHARQIGIGGINVDLIYGLPLQTVEGFDRTLRQVIDLGVDRIALYNFAFLPETVKQQQAMDPTQLPDSSTRLAIFMLALQRFAEAGYRQIGLDHFAKPGDELNAALQNGTMQRNFMGYTTRAGRDLLAFGVSAISRVGRDFAQNHKTLDVYHANLSAGHLPIERGLHLSEDDLLREEIIQQIMCYGRVDVGRLCADHGQNDIGQGPSVQARLEPLIQDGLIEWENGVLAVNDLGRYFLRNIAMVFDAYLSQPTDPAQTGVGRVVRFSQTV